MTRRALLLAVLTGGLALGLGASYGPSMVRGYWREQERNDVTRGLNVARRAGCLSCHGPGGTQGIPNPGGDRPVPSIASVHTREEAREYIEDGLPKAKRERREREGRPPRGRIVMPAYKDVLSKKEIDQLVAWCAAVAGIGGPAEGSPAAKGRAIAREKGCFGCHGLDGAGLLSNPGSFKGYIPGWRGPDFDELVRGDEELREWILDGVSKRFADDAAAQSYLAGAKIAMPAYRGVLTDEELEAIVAYVRSLRAPGRN